MYNGNVVKSEREEERIRSLLSLIPGRSPSVLDIGAREGYISVQLTDHFDSVTALDLEKPNIVNDNVTCVQGDVTNLQFPDKSFHTVFCSEVLEHIPQDLLHKACNEIQRVAQKHIIIGVPYRQDIRVGRTTCYTCGMKNPPWGHVNTFDETKITSLFSEVSCEKIRFHGDNTEHTNFLSALLTDLAGNPYGDYSQLENCIYCGNSLKPPPERNLLQKVCTRLAFYINGIQSYFVRHHPVWINILFRVH
ncbi:MAG: class I SAM-dependent methyltransferase [Syntrophales bacterium]|nr:class I SAM-dependent methyltransferase [Syntrophales bacterium]